MALAWLGVAALLTAFWALPLLARAGETRALAWGSLTIQPAHLPLVLALAAAALFALRAVRSPAEGVVARLPWAVGLVVGLDALVLEPAGLRWLPADRVLDAGWLALVLAAGLGVGRAIARLAERGRVPSAVAALGGVGLAIALSVTSDRTLAPAGVETLALWPRAGAWPSLAATERGLRLSALWAALRTASPGRVLFVRSSVPLVYGTAWWRPHTHVTALTPVAAARPIVNGTFTHPSPVAALVYRGSAGHGAITSLVERLDGESLFGRPLDVLDAATLNDHARRLGISVVVALEDDLPRLAALVDNALFRARRVEPPFVMWLGPAAPLPEPSGPGRWRVTLPPSGGEWTSAGMAYYPLWRAAANGRPVATRAGADGQLEVRASGGAIELTYGPGAPELAGVALTVAGILLWLVYPSRAAAPASAHS